MVRETLEPGDSRAPLNDSSVSRPVILFRHRRCANVTIVPSD